jgi:hypothetical protein
VVSAAAATDYAVSAAEWMYSKLIATMRKCSFTIECAFLHIVFQVIAVVKPARAAALTKHEFDSFPAEATEKN